MTATPFPHHAPCELGRGSGIYEEPRELLRMAGRLAEPVHNHAEALCCGSSLANTVINDGQQATIGRSMTSELEATGADTIVTACPLCKKALTDCGWPIFRKLWPNICVPRRRFRSEALLRSWAAVPERELERLRVYRLLPIRYSWTVMHVRVCGDCPPGYVL